MRRNRTALTWIDAARVIVLLLPTLFAVGVVARYVAEEKAEAGAVPTKMKLEPLPAWQKKELEERAIFEKQVLQSIDKLRAEVHALSRRK